MLKIYEQREPRDRKPFRPIRQQAARKGWETRKAKV